MTTAFQDNAFQVNAFQIDVVANIVGGHFLPKNEKHKRTLSNVLIVYEKAKSLSRVETKELRDAISEFIAPEIAGKPVVPNIESLNYELLKSNELAHEKFLLAIENIEKKLGIFGEKIREDDELLLMAIMACATYW